MTIFKKQIGKNFYRFIFIFDGSVNAVASPMVAAVAAADKCSGGKGDLIEVAYQ